MRSLGSLLSRASFALALVLPAAWLVLPRSEAGAAVTRERLVPSATALVIDKTNVGTLRSAAGGSAVGTVVTEGMGPENTVKKHVGAVGYEPLELELDLSLDRSLYDWIGAAWAGKAQPKSGALSTLDARGAGLTREFHNALISETIVPALDASSKEPAFITLILAPERVSSVASSGAKVAAGASKGAKSWLASNFKLEIDGLDCSRVSRVEGLHFQQALTSSPGTGRDPGKRGGSIELGNLRVTLSEAGADSWRNWHEDFVVKGNSSDKSERSGRVLLLAANLKDELARIELANLGIVALRPRPSAAGAGQLEAELYVERMGFALTSK
jgi:hypothetical protein